MFIAFPDVLSFVVWLRSERLKESTVCIRDVGKFVHPLQTSLQTVSDFQLHTMWNENQRIKMVFFSHTNFSAVLRKCKLYLLVPD